MIKHILNLVNRFAKPSDLHCIGEAIREMESDEKTRHLDDSVITEKEESTLAKPIPKWFCCQCKKRIVDKEDFYPMFGGATAFCKSCFMMGK